MAQNTTGNFFEFLGIPNNSKIANEMCLEFLGLFGNGQNTSENYWEFLGIQIKDKVE